MQAFTERLKAREPQALTELFDEYFERIYTYVRRMVVDEHTAEDLTQDIFLNIHRGLDGFDVRRELEPWIFSIVRNKIRDHWRSARHHASRRDASIDEDELGPRLSDDGEGPSEPLERREAASIVHDAIEKLPEGMRRTVELRLFEGLPFSAVGRALGRNTDAVRKRYSRAVALLREALGSSADSLVAGGRCC